MKLRSARRCVVLVGCAGQLVLSAGELVAAPRKGAPEALPPVIRGSEHAVDSHRQPEFAAKPPKDLLLAADGERKADALAAFVDGMIAEDDADADRALESWQRSLNLDPSHTKLALQVAMEKARRGAVDEGINVLKDSIKASPKDPLPYLYLSQLYLKYLRKIEPATRYAQQALDLDAGHLPSYLALYEIHALNSQRAKAEAVLDRAVKTARIDPPGWVQITELYRVLLLPEDGEPDPAALQKMVGLLGEAREGVKGDPMAMAKIADYYVLARQVPEAIPLYLDALKSRKETAPADFLASVQDKLARSFRVTGQRDEAIAMLEKLIKENALRYESYEFLGELYEEAGDYVKALTNYQQALLIDASDWKKHLHVANMLLRNQRPDEAVEILRAARDKFPNHTGVSYFSALSLMQAKRYTDALPIFEETLVVAQDRGEPELLSNEFYFNYGATAERAGLFDKAAGLLRKSIELDPNGSAEACNYLGYMWIDRGENLEEAGALVQRALDQQPQNPAYIDSLGWCYFKKAEYDKALEQLLRAAELMEREKLGADDAEIFVHIGDTYGKLNKPADALVYWQKAAALNPDDKSVGEKIENAKQKVAAKTP